MTRLALLLLSLVTSSSWADMMRGSNTGVNARGGNGGFPGAPRMEGGGDDSAGMMGVCPYSVQVGK